MYENKINDDGVRMNLMTSFITCVNSAVNNQGEAGCYCGVCTNEKVFDCPSNKDYKNGKGCDIYSDLRLGNSKKLEKALSESFDITKKERAYLQLRHIL